eukprot:3135469-Amphidinium_carterae.1
MMSVSHWQQVLSKSWNELVLACPTRWALQSDEADTVDAPATTLHATGRGSDAHELSMNACTQGHVKAQPSEIECKKMIRIHKVNCTSGCSTSESAGATHSSGIICSCGQMDNPMALDKH